MKSTKEPPHLSAVQLRRQRDLQALDANALELFARVVEAGSFARAARQLGQTRAAISRRISAMEALVGQPLLARTTRSLGLTEAGRALALRAQAVREAAEAARLALRKEGHALQGRLRITCMRAFGHSVLLPLLAEFRRQHPGIALELLFTERRVDLVREGVDVAFRVTRQPPEDCVAAPVLRFRIGAYAAPTLATGAAGASSAGAGTGTVADALAGSAIGPAGMAAPAPEGGAAAAQEGPQALLQLPLLLLEGGAQSWPLRWQRRDGGGSCVVELQSQVSADNLEALLALARAGCGVVLAPDFCVREDLAQGRLVDLLPDWELPIAEGDCVQALTLPAATAGANARALVRMVAQRLAPLVA
ncbi:MAG: LysR family transcriptional regulator [Rhodoferax sp.]